MISLLEQLVWRRQEKRKKDKKVKEKKKREEKKRKYHMRQVPECLGAWVDVMHSCSYADDIISVGGMNLPVMT